MTLNRETAERSTILSGLVGSTVHGLNVNDGIEDRDEIGVCVEPFEAAMSLRERLCTTVGDVSGQIHFLVASGSITKPWRICRKKAGLRSFSDEPVAEIVQCGEPRL